MISATNYEIPKSVKRLCCMKAGASCDTRVNLIHFDFYGEKYQGKPRLIIGGLTPLVRIYIPWVASKGDLVRMLWQDEIDKQNFQRDRIMKTPPEVIDATERIETAEFLLKTFPKHHVRFQKLLDDATELEATARLLEAAYGRPEPFTTQGRFS